jgi:hypothetical protein
MVMSAENSDGQLRKYQHALKAAMEKPTVREETEALNEAWTKLGKTLQGYTESVQIRRKRLAAWKEPNRWNDGFQYVAKIYERTSDPILGQALRVLLSCGLQGSDWDDVARRIELDLTEQISGTESLVIDAVEKELEELARAGKPRSKSRAYRRVAARMQIEAANFEAACERVKEICERRANRSEQPCVFKPAFPYNIGIYADQLGYIGGSLRIAVPEGCTISAPELGGRQYGPGKHLVPNSLFWRRLISTGAVKKYAD